MWSRLDWKRWRSRIVLGIMLLTLLILAGVSLYTYLAYQRAAGDLAIESDRQLTYVSAARLRDELNRFSEELDNLARTQKIYRGRVGEQVQALREARHRLTIFDGGVVLLDNFGRVRTSEPARPEIQGADWSGRQFFRELLGSSRAFYSDITNDGPTGAPVAAISVPIAGENGEFVGVLVGMFRLGESRISSLYASIVRLRIGQSGHTYVLDRGGRVLYDSGYVRIGDTLNMPAQGAAEIQGVAFRTIDPDGNDIIAAFAPILGTGWTLVSEDEWETATGATQRYANTLLVLLALGMVLPALGVALLVRTQNAEILERELSIQEQRVAWLIQERLLPRVVPMLPGWNLEVFYKPHPASGGDFYDVYLLQDGRLALTLGHANTKGLDAAHVIDTMRAALRGAAQLQLPPDKALAHGNRLVCPELQGEACLTALHAILDPTTGRLVYASAGAIPPWHCAGPIDAKIPVEGAALGKDMRCEFQQRSLTIQPGQCALIFSEGLFRARRPSGELFDLAALQVIVAEPAWEAEDMAEALAAQLKSYTGIKGMPPEDVTVLIVQRHATASPNADPSQTDRPASHALLAPDFDLDRGDLP